MSEVQTDDSQTSNCQLGIRTCPELRVKVPDVLKRESQSLQFLHTLHDAAESLHGHVALYQLKVADILAACYSGLQNTACDPVAVVEVEGLYMKGCSSQIVDEEVISQSVTALKGCLSESNI